MLSPYAIPIKHQPMIDENTYLEKEHELQVTTVDLHEHGFDEFKKAHPQSLIYSIQPGGSHPDDNEGSMYVVVVYTEPVK